MTDRLNPGANQMEIERTAHKSHTHAGANAMMWLTAAIWGFAFVAQRVGMEHIGPFAFNGIRFLLGGICLVPLLWWISKKKEASALKKALPGGLLVGLVLFSASALQQVGMQWTGAGKAGFITGLYVILVPVIGIFIGQSVGRRLWLGAVLALAGLFLLTVQEKFTIEKGDIYILLSACCWAMHVQLINSLVNKYPPLTISVIQFITCGLLSLIPMALFENTTLQGVLDAGIPILYGGLISVGIAYTLQVYAQRYVHPAYASIILSFETVFAVLGGWLILHESLSARNLAGCALMMAGMLVVQARRSVQN
jgi:drug/metabolite transporter (DMT)-like permease